MNETNPGDLAGISDAIRRAGDERIERLKKEGPSKLYVIYTDLDTRGGPTRAIMGQYHGSYRQLLEWLYAGDPADWDSDCKAYLETLSDGRLLEILDERNGDGGNYQAVWCVDDRQAILGAISIDQYIEGKKHG